MKSFCGERRLGLLALLAAGVAGLTLAATASPATATIQVGSLLVVSGSVTGTVSGFQPNATVTVNGSSYIADAAGVVALSGAPLGGSAQLAIGFVDSDGAGRTVTTGLTDATSGATLSASDLLDAIPDTTAPVTLVLDGGGTTTTGTTTTGTATTGTTTTTSGSGGTSGSGSALSGAQKLGDGSVSIPSSSVVTPYRLVIKKVVFSPRLIRAHHQAISIRYRVGDTQGHWVRNAAVLMRTLPLRRLSSVKPKRTSMTGWVTFSVRTGTSVKLQKGGRVNIFVRAWTPGEAIIGGTSTRRLVSLRVSTHR